jgi:hypothetical protein
MTIIEIRPFRNGWQMYECVADAFQVTPTKIECRAQSESTEIFDRAEAAKCLPRSGRLRSCCMVSHAAYDADLPVFRNS